jgi:mono/diheme cytochrome c family protein
MTRAASLFDAAFGPTKGFRHGGIPFVLGLRPVILGLLAVLSLLAAPAARAAEAGATLIVKDGHRTRIYTTRVLMALPGRRAVAIADPVYRRRMRLLAVPVADLLKGLTVAADATIQARATDGFSVSIPLSVARRALLAVEPAGSPWPPLPAAAHEQGGTGPFRLVWTGPDARKVGSEFWAYRLAALSAVPGPVERWPVLAVGRHLPAHSPIRKGLTLFVANCMACHRFEGAGEADMGPDLGRPANPATYFRLGALRAYIRDPASLRDWPGRRMPRFGRETLSDADIDAIVDWLAYKARTIRPTAKAR